MTAYSSLHIRLPLLAAASPNTILLCNEVTSQPSKAFRRLWSSVRNQRGTSLSIALKMYKMFVFASIFAAWFLLPMATVHFPFTTKMQAETPSFQKVAGLKNRTKEAANNSCKKMVAKKERKGAQSVPLTLMGMWTEKPLVTYNHVIARATE